MRTLIHVHGRFMMRYVLLAFREAETWRVENREGLRLEALRVNACLPKSHEQNNT